MIERRMMGWTIASIWAFGFVVWITENPLIQGFFFILIAVIIVLLAVAINDRAQQRERWHQEQLEYRVNKTQQAEEKTHEQLDTLVETMTSGFLLVDYDGVLTMANKAARELFIPHTKTQNTLDDLKPLKTLYEAIYQSFIAEKPTRHQVRIGEKTYDIQTSPLFQTKLFMGLIVILSDITQLKQAEQFQKQFTADVTHELKTPLSAILGSSELLLTHANMDRTSQEEFIQTIHIEAKRLETLINDLLIIAKMDRLDYELKKEPTDIDVLIQECVQTTRHLFENKQLNLSVECEPCTVILDPAKTRQVFLNLLRNAANYTDTGSVEVQGVLENQHYRVSVKDTGIGIAPKEHENIFKRFYRVDEARSRDFGGSGLGLSIIKNVVLKHQGKIHLESAVGEGSTFTVWFPYKNPS